MAELNRSTNDTAAVVDSVAVTLIGPGLIEADLATDEVVTADSAGFRRNPTTTSQVDLDRDVASAKSNLDGDG